MIISASTGQGFRGAISYVEKEHEKNLTPEQRPEILQQNNIAGTAQEKAQQMRFVANGNSRASRPVLHVSVSFSEKEKITPQQRDKVLNDVVKELGATPENNQYQIVKHNDAGHEHYHIVLNKVGFDGKNIDTSYIKNKCQVIADKLEQKHELQRVKGRTIVYDPSNEKGYRYTTKAERSQSLKKPQDREQGVKDKKAFIQQEVGKALKESKSLTELKEKLATKGIETKYTQNKNGLSGVSFRYENQAVKGSAIGYKAKDISTGIEQNSGRKIEPYQEIKAPQKESFLQQVANKIEQEEAKNRKVKEFQISQQEKFRDQLTDLKTHTNNVIDQVKENAYKGENKGLKDSDKVSVIVDERGKVFVQHKENERLKFEVREVGYIAQSEGRKGEKEREYQMKMKEYQDVQRAEYMSVPPAIQFWKADERKKALAYNERLRIKKQTTREPQRTLFVGGKYKMYTIENIEKLRLTTQAKINTMKQELEKGKGQEVAKEPKREQAQENRMERAERLRAEKAEEREQAKQQNRGFRR